MSHFCLKDMSLVHCQWLHATHNSNLQQSCLRFCDLEALLQSCNLCCGALQGRFLLCGLSSICVPLP